MYSTHFMFAATTDSECYALTQLGVVLLLDGWWWWWWLLLLLLVAAVTAAARQNISPIP